MPLTTEQKASLDTKGTDWKRVTYVDADEALDGLKSKSGALLVDVRAEEVFAEEHFASAVNKRGKDAHLTLPRETPIYLYCT